MRSLKIMLSPFLFIIFSSALNPSTILPAIKTNWEVVDQTETTLRIRCPTGGEIHFNKPKVPYRSLATLEHTIFNQCANLSGNPKAVSYLGEIIRQSHNVVTLKAQTRRIAREKARTYCQGKGFHRLSYEGNTISCRTDGINARCRAKWYTVCNTEKLTTLPSKR